MAGTPKSANCTLILTEGDSAKALAISGLGVVGRDYYGVFPLKVIPSLYINRLSMCMRIYLIPSMLCSRVNPPSIYAVYV
jgi:hypothetical protein